MTTSEPAAIYARISMKNEKTGKNLTKTADQIKALQKLRAERGYELVDIYEDDGVSAKDAGLRDDFDRMMRDLAAGKIKVILATEDARLARNHFEKPALMFACAAVGARWETLRDGNTDPATATGEFMSMVRGAVDTFESKRKAERMREENANRRADGVMFKSGAVPFGYNDDRLTLCEPEADLIRTGIAMINRGQGLLDVVRVFRESGLAPRRSQTWQHISVRDMLTPWRNAGVVSFRGEPSETLGQWNAIVSREELESARAILLGSGGTGEKRRASRLVSGLAFCGTCGEWMAGQNRAGKPHYACSARNRGLHLDKRHVSIRVSQLDPIVRKAVIDSYFVSSPGALPTHAEDEAALGELHERLSEVRKGIADLIDSIGRPGYTRVRVDQAVARLSVQETQLAEQIEDRARRSAHAAMMVDTFSLITTRTSWDDADKHKDALTARFDSLSFEQQRTLVRSLVRVTVHPGVGTDRVQVQHLGASVLDVEGDPGGAAWSA